MRESRSTGFIKYELRGMNLKIAVYWIVVLCSLLEVYRRLRGAWCLQHQGDCPDSGRYF